MWEGRLTSRAPQKPLSSGRYILISGRKVVRWSSVQVARMAAEAATRGGKVMHVSACARHKGGDFGGGIAGGAPGGGGG